LAAIAGSTERINKQANTAKSGEADNVVDFNKALLARRNAQSDSTADTSKDTLFTKKVSVFSTGYLRKIIETSRSAIVGSFGSLTARLQGVVAKALNLYTTEIVVEEVNQDPLTLKVTRVQTIAMLKLLETATYKR